MTKPKKQAYVLAQTLKNFKRDLFMQKIDRKANAESGEVARVVSWSAFDELIDQLELCYNGDLMKA